MDTIFALLCVGCVTAVSAVNNFKLTDCTGNTPNRLFRFNNVSLDPPVIHIPGNETGSLDVEILRNISGDHFKLDVSIKKHILFAYVKIPCIHGHHEDVGSCTYSNLCDLFTRFLDKNGTAQCPPILQQNNFPCTCPFLPGHYHINPVTFKIKPLKDIYQQQLIQLAEMYTDARSRAEFGLVYILEALARINVDQAMFQPMIAAEAYSEANSPTVVSPSGHLPNSPTVASPSGHPSKLPTVGV